MSVHITIGHFVNATLSNPVMREAIYSVTGFDYKHEFSTMT